MKFVNVRDIRNRPGKVWDELEDHDLVLTSHGKPVALVVRLDDEDVEETARALRMARAHLALERIRRDAAARGLDRWSEKQVETLIRRTRSRRR